MVSDTVSGMVSGDSMATKSSEENHQEGVLNLVLYVRKWNCAVCDKPVIYDSEKGELTCGCCKVKLAVKPLDLATSFVKLAEKVRSDGFKR